MSRMSNYEKSNRVDQRFDIERTARLVELPPSPSQMWRPIDMKMISKALAEGALHTTKRQRKAWRK